MPLEALLRLFPLLDRKSAAAAEADPEAPIAKLNEEQLYAAALEELKLKPAVFYEFLELRIKEELLRKVAPKFWEHLDPALCTAEETDGASGNERQRANQTKLFQRFVTAVNELHEDVLGYRDVLRRADKLAGMLPEKPDFFISVRTLPQYLRPAMLAQLPGHFDIYVDAFFEKCFRLFQKQQQHVESGISELELNKVHCLDCADITDNQACVCEHLFELITAVNAKLLDMQLLDNIAGYSIKQLIQTEITEHIQISCSGAFDKSHINELQLWLERAIISWLKSVYTSNAGPHDNIEKVLSGFRVKLQFYIYEQFAHCVIEQFFSIIIDFPDSMPIIDDLKTCMRQIDLKKYFTSKLKKSLKDRLLHPGVNTMDILIGYVATIKAIRYLDSSGIILDVVSSPIKEYLKTRSDTVRQVVTALTEDGPTDLSEELGRVELNNEEKNAAAAAQNDIAEWENWQPEPWDLDPKRASADPAASQPNKSSDVISMVIDIYGSKELFMVEYRNLMADRLLTQLDFNMEKELRNLELLKIRFGEQLLHDCEVMLKDITDSKRLNSNIQAANIIQPHEETFGIEALIISDQFWPTFNKEHLVLPDELQAEFDKYTKCFESHKGNRTLNWRTVTGKVDIELEYEGRTIELTVPPTQAVIIYHFQHKSEWCLEELSSLIKIPPTTLRRRISFWQNQNIIAEKSPGVYTLLEYQKEPQSDKLEEQQERNADDDDESTESAMASASEQREEHLKLRWVYIDGMLTNIGPMSIDSIHQMFKICVPDGGIPEFSKEELNAFLMKKVREHKLLMERNMFKLP